MKSEEFVTDVTGGMLVGTVTGEGVPVLLLHGGPGLACDDLEDLVPELVDGYRVAWYQQRGVGPSTARAPYDVATHVADVIHVLDTLGWDRAAVLGHSWGGHLLLHVIAVQPDRLLAAVVIDPLGAVGDGGEAHFAAEMTARIPADGAARVAEIEARASIGDATTEEALEFQRLIWPSYFADPSTAPAMPDTAFSIDAFLQTNDSVHEELPRLAGRLAGTSVPTVFVHGASSPMPLTASTDSAAAMGANASVVVVPGTGHFIWHESPGAVRAALDELLSR